MVSLVFELLMFDSQEEGSIVVFSRCEMVPARVSLLWFCVEATEMLSSFISVCRPITSALDYRCLNPTLPNSLSQPEGF